MQLDFVSLSVIGRHYRDALQTRALPTRAPSLWLQQAHPPPLDLELDCIELQLDGVSLVGCLCVLHTRGLLSVSRCLWPACSRLVSFSYRHEYQIR